MKIVLLERNSAGTDVPVDCFYELGEVTSYPNTVTVEEVAERVGDADVMADHMLALMEDKKLGESFSKESVKIREELTDDRIFGMWKALLVR